MLGVIFWMYGGYAWMTNAVAADTVAQAAAAARRHGRRTSCSRSRSRMRSASGLAFGLAYLAIVARAHDVLHARAVGGRRERDPAPRAVEPGLRALVVLVGGALGGSAQYVLWGSRVVPSG